MMTLIRICNKRLNYDKNRLKLLSVEVATTNNIIFNHLQNRLLY